MNVRVKVDPKVCIGSGSCMVLASKHFAFNKKGKAEPTQSEGDKPQGSELLMTVTAAERKQLIEAARACPTQAISIVDENGKKIY
jgi:ferredoxin